MVEATQEARAIFAGIELERSSGGLVIRNRAQFEPVLPSTYQALVCWAGRTPDAIFLAERESGGWREVCYADALSRVDDLARRLLTLGCGPERPLAIVSENSVEHALVALAAMSVAIPVAPISIAYATLAADFSRLRFMLELVEPAAIFFGEPERCAAASNAVQDIAPVVHAGSQALPGWIALDDIAPKAEHAWHLARDLVDQDTVAKLMFTSGSTGKPKAVINTQRMICSNQAMLLAIWPNIGRTPPVLVDWLPWSHTFGANFTFNLALFNGGALYIDAGRPVPQKIGITLENVAEIMPTVYFNVPSGYEALLAHLREDEQTAQKVFSRMEFALFAAAALPQTVRDELQALALKCTGRHLPFYTGWGSTETAPCATATWWDTEQADNIGLPLPGVELKLAPDGAQFEMRVRGPTVTPGYWKDEGRNREAFDTDGFYRMGDAGVLVDDSAPAKGVRFDGRVSENFKLRNGTWVNVGAIRVGALDKGRPYISDAVVAGSGRSEIGLLVFINHQACRGLCGQDGSGLSDADLSARPEIRAEIGKAIAAYNGVGRGSSSRVARFLILPDQPRMEAFEITDKGYINQRAVLSARSEQVDRLYEDNDHVI